MSTSMTGENREMQHSSSESDNTDVTYFPHINSSSSVNSTSVTSQTYQVYKRRWFILFVVCFLNISNAMLWLTFSPVANLTKEYYDTSFMGVNWLSLIFLIASIPFGFVTTWVLDTIGLRSSILISAWLNGVGAILRGISTLDVIGSSAKFPVVITGQVLTACAQTFVMFCPTKLAALWFAENQRATANMLASMANPLGILVANLIGPQIVKEANDIPTLMWATAGPAGFIMIVATFGICSSVPPTPPSSSAAEESEPFFQGVKKLLRIKPYWILCYTFGTGLAIFSATTTFLEQIVCARNYSNDFAGLCGALLIAVGALGALIAGLFIDKTKKFEEVTKVSFGLAVVLFTLFLELARYRGIPIHVAVSVGAFGFFGLALYPIMMELAVECTYPIAEATSSGLLFISGQIQGLIYMLAAQFLTQPLSAHEQTLPNKCNVQTGPVDVEDWTVPTLFMAGMGTFAALLFIIFFRTDYKRLIAEEKAKGREILHYGEERT